MGDFEFGTRLERSQHTFGRQKISAHARSLSAPEYPPSTSGSWDFFRSKFNLDTTIDKTRRWSCMLQAVDVEIDHKHKRRIILEQDVKDLERRLQNEKSVRKALEKALQSSFEPLPCVSSISPETKKLIKEIAALEVEVVSLEQHVLSLYRKLYDTKVQSPFQDLPRQFSLKRRQRKAHSIQHRRHVSAACETVQENGPSCSSSSSKTRHASLFGGGTFDKATSIHLYKPGEPKDGRVWPQSRKLEVMMASPRLFKEDNLYRNPNFLSEEMVRCMALIYCKLADPPLPPLGEATPSPPSSTLTSSTSTSRDVSSDGWSPRWKDSSSAGNNTSSVIEVPWIRVDKERLSYAARALQSFRSMVEQLERVRLGEMENEEKLAFWINLYNALVMHAYLAYGIPRNSHLKRVSLLQKAAYKVGAHSINAHTIEHTILGCRPQRPAQWLQTLFSPSTKFKTEERRAYAVSNPEPLVLFALCSGGRSDPPVRVYTAKELRSELETAMRDFLHANISCKDNTTLQLPKLVESYTRDVGISSSSAKVIDWAYHNASHKQQNLIKSSLQSKPKRGTTSRSSSLRLEWTPYDSSFRYSFCRELATTSH